MHRALDRLTNPMMRLALVVAPALVLALVPPGDARADTLGLLRTTPIAEEATIATPLAVRFVSDAMVDGGLFAHTNTGEGVESTEVAVVPGVALATAGKASLREQAERAVVATLTAAERTQLLVGPLGGPLRRIPHGWTALDVIRGRDGWTITYDKLVFAVDARTGAVSRPKP